MEMLARILEDETCHGILLDIGLPVTHRNVNYNCRVVCLDGKILFIRPKMRKCSRLYPPHMTLPSYASYIWAGLATLCC